MERKGGFSESDLLLLVSEKADSRRSDGLEEAAIR